MNRTHTTYGSRVDDTLKRFREDMVEEEVEAQPAGEPIWTHRYSPAAYLRNYPTGPHAILAQAIIKWMEGS